MKKTTFYIHSDKDKIINVKDDEYRLVTFVNGTKDILEIIKELIKDKY